MRISFSLPSNSTSKPNPIKPSTEQPPPKPRVIPPIPNEWQPGITTLDSEIPYGLNLRRRPDSDEAAIRKLKEDLKGLPEIRGVEEFDENPVEGFGAALLAGYGWQPGTGIGKNAKEDVGVVELRSNVGRQGLGFRPE